jgi:broad specificity phosphatase PhoE
MEISMKLKTGALVLLALCLAPAVAHAQKLVILVRHAERADGGAPPPGMTKTPADPLLSAAGEVRAQKLAAMLADAGVTAMYTTEFRRTQDTAKPLAAKLGVTAAIVPADDLAGLIAKIKGAKPADVVMVVGHSNTLPGVIKQLGGPAVTIGDNEYDNLFIVVPQTGAMTRIRY